MSKILKRLLVTLIFLIVAILVISKSEKAFEVSDSMIISGGWYDADVGSPYKEQMGTLRSNGTGFRIMAHSAMILNKFVFCIEENQHLPPTTIEGYTEFNCRWKITIKDGNVYQNRNRVNGRLCKCY